jgi:hypothetical protein
VRRPRATSPAVHRSAFAGFRFPAEVITVGGPLVPPVQPVPDSSSELWSSVIAAGHAFVQNLRRKHDELAIDIHRRPAWRERSANSPWPCDQHFFRSRRPPRHAERNEPSTDPVCAVSGRCRRRCAGSRGPP